MSPLFGSNLVYVCPKKLESNDPLSSAGVQNGNNGCMKMALIKGVSSHLLEVWERQSKEVDVVKTSKQGAEKGAEPAKHNPEK